MRVRHSALLVRFASLAHGGCPFPSLRPQLREALKLATLPADSPVARFCTDACLCRYLRARGWDEATFKAKLAKSKYGRSNFARPKHKVAGTAANLVWGV